MKKRFLSFILVLFLVVPCIFLLTACGKVDAQVAVDKVLTDVINKYDNKIVTTRHLDFKKVVEYKGNTVYVYYNSEDEKDVSDDGIVYPERFEKEEDSETNENDSIDEFNWDEFKAQYEIAQEQLDKQDKAMEMERARITTRIDMITTEMEGAQKMLTKNIETEMKGLGE